VLPQTEMRVREAAVKAQHLAVSRGHAEDLQVQLYHGLREAVPG